MPVSTIILFHHGRRQPHLDQMEHTAVRDTAGYALHQFGVRNRVEVLTQICVQNIGISLDE